MKVDKTDWSKAELRIDILLFCEKADHQETKVKIELMKSKTDQKTFN